MSTVLQPGDLLAVRTGGLAGKLIRLGAALLDHPNLENHVAMLSHKDAQGRWWVIEGRPGGVGWADARSYLASPYTLNNALQSGRDQGARQRVVKAAAALLGTPYDWEAIADDTLRAFRMRDLWAGDWNGKAPGHVVCSSYDAYLYETEHWDRPRVPDRDTEPSDWTSFILAGRYHAPDAVLPS